MEVQWFKRDKEAVLDDLRRGVRPLMATTMSSGPLDELIALHDELASSTSSINSPSSDSARGSTTICCSEPWLHSRSCPSRASTHRPGSSFRRA